MFVAGRAVAEMIAALDIVRHRVAQPRQFGEHVVLVAGRAVREIVLEYQHLLADIPLDRQVPMRNRVGDFAQCREQGTLIGRQIRCERSGADIHVARGHRRRQADLETNAGRDFARIAQATKDGIGVARGRGVAGVERDRGRIDAGLEPQPVRRADQGAVPLAQLERRRVGIEFHRRMVQQHFPLPPDPAMPIAGLAIRDAGEERPKLVAPRHGTRSPRRGAARCRSGVRR